MILMSLFLLKVSWISMEKMSGETEICNTFKMTLLLSLC